MSYIINGTEVKVGQIWEVRGGSVWIKITSLDELIRGVCVRPGVPNGGMPWDKDEQNTWFNNGVFWYNDPGPHDLLKLVQDITSQEPIVLTLHSPEGFSGSCTRNGKVEYEVWDQHGVAKINPMNTLKYRIRKDEGFVLCNVRHLVCSDTHVTDLVDEYNTEKQARDMQEPDQQLLRFFYEDGKIVKVDVLT